MFALSDEVVNGQDVKFFSYDQQVMTGTESLALALGKKHSTVLKKVQKIKDEASAGIVIALPEVEELLLDADALVSYALTISSKKDLDICREYLHTFYRMGDKNAELQQQPIVQLCNSMGEEAFLEWNRKEKRKDAVLIELAWLLDKTNISVDIPQTIKNVQIQYVLNSSYLDVKSEEEIINDFTALCKSVYYELLAEEIIKSKLTATQATQCLKEVDDLWGISDEDNV